MKQILTKKRNICAKGTCENARKRGPQRFLKFCELHEEYCTQQDCYELRSTNDYRCSKHRVDAVAKSKRKLAGKNCTKCEQPRANGDVHCLRHRHDQRMRRLYKIGIDEFEKLLTTQGGVCAICSQKREHVGASGWHVDHEHESGRIRGILCNKCNVGIGMLQDSAVIMLKAARYLGGL